MSISLRTVFIATLMLVSANAQAMVSRCAPGPDPDSFYHEASLGMTEYTYPIAEIRMDTQVIGPISPIQSSTSFGNFSSWHWFRDMPPGEYAWIGYSEAMIDDIDPFMDYYGWGGPAETGLGYSDAFWDLFQIGICYGAMLVVQEEVCDTNLIQVTSSSALTSNLHGYIVTAIQGGFEAVEKLGVCTIGGTPTFSGSLQMDDVAQCCNSAGTLVDTATRASGNATFRVPTLSCSLRQIIVPAYGIVLEGRIGAGAAANFGYSGMNRGMCGNTAQPITLSGSVTGSFGGEIGVGGISTQIVGAGVSIYDDFSIAASGPDLFNLTLIGCIGPAQISGWFRFLGNEYSTNIFPAEAAQGTELCF